MKSRRNITDGSLDFNLHSLQRRMQRASRTGERGLDEIELIPTGIELTGRQLINNIMNFLFHCGEAAFYMLQDNLKLANVY